MKKCKDNCIDSYKAICTYQSLNSRYIALFHGYHRLTNKTFKLAIAMPLMVIALVSTFAVQSEWIRLLILEVSILNEPYTCNVYRLSNSRMIRARKYVDCFTIYFVSHLITISLKKNQYHFDESTYSIKNKNDEHWKYSTSEEWVKMHIELTMSKKSKFENDEIDGIFKLTIFNEFANESKEDALINISFKEDALITPSEIVIIKSLFITDGYKDIEIM